MSDAQRDEGAPLQATPLDPLCTDIRGLSRMLGVSVRHLRSMNARAVLPAALSVGRRRLWRTEEVTAWVRAGMPSRERWRWPNGGAR